MTISLILAVADNGGIGIGNKLPWNYIREDMSLFRDITTGNVVVMGRKTWDGLPTKPLPFRENVLLTRQVLDTSIGVTQVCGKPENVIRELKTLYDDKKIIIIGGAEVYKQYIPLVDEIYITRIRTDVYADTFIDIDALMGNKFKLTETRSIRRSFYIDFEYWERVEENIE